RRSPRPPRSTPGAPGASAWTTAPPSPRSARRCGRPTTRTPDPHRPVPSPPLSLPPPPPAGNRIVPSPHATLPPPRPRLPGTLDGGDILKIGDTVYVGRGGRTNAEGVRQLRAAFEPLGARVVAIPISRVLHLKSAVTALPDGTVIGHPALVEDPALFPAFRP